MHFSSSRDLFSYSDIVQEGLDIPTCSYVIRYEFVSDEIGTIQSRGRARAQRSSYYLITELDSTNHRREQNNKVREDEMETAIAQWPKLDKVLFDRDVTQKTVSEWNAPFPWRFSVRRFQASLVQVWEEELKRAQQESEALRRIGKRDGSICCRKCSRELGELAWLKRRNTTYFINDRPFFERTDARLKNAPESFQEHLVIGKGTFDGFSSVRMLAIV